MGRLPLSEELPPLAAAKLAAPRQREGMVARPRLSQALDAGAGAALTLVSAPPGYGKTTAVRAWCAGGATAWAWVTLDDDDDDPVRLWTYAATAVDRVREGLGRRALNRLRVSGMPVEVAVDEVMNGIAAYGRELAVVLDDFHCVTAHECLSSVQRAVERLPANGRLIMLTRADPQIGLARLRARGCLSEVRVSDFAFTASEAREVLVVRGGLNLHDSDIDVLMERTEGWPAAVYLAALWLRTVSDPRRAVRRFGGDHRYVAEYLSREVLASLDPTQREFLINAAVLGRFTPALCNGVLDRSDSAAALAELEERNMLVLPLERHEWFRVHSLFAQFATASLASVQPDAVPNIHRRAAGWLRSQGLIVEATEHAAAAGDHRAVAELLSQYHLALVRKGSARTLLRWVRTLPGEVLMEYPELVLGAATAATIVGQLTLARRRFLELASRAKQARPEHFGAYADALMSVVRCVGVDAGVVDAVSEGTRAVELARQAGADLLVDALAGLAHALYLAGEPDRAWTTASQAVEHPDAERVAPGYTLARSTLALVASDGGRLGSARVHAERARTAIGRITCSRSWLGGHASVALGAVLAGEGDLAGAEREFVSADRFFSDEVANVHHARLLVRLADVRRRRGRIDEAEGTLVRVREAIAELPDCGVVPAHAADAWRELGRARRQATDGKLTEAPTEAELAVMRLLVSDLSARGIGQRLFLSPNTVRSHMRAIYRKLAVSSRADAVARATALGLMEESARMA
ncbi:MAG TPA: LuxR C-terminal-related transcriptional regulator [Solirubrobacteraceae bacterium]|nr:LuxR C-terminal-related transcriptional regulator [Solirubrobacteraceae bacterium]